MSATTEGKLYAWCEIGPDAREGIIAAIVPGFLGPGSPEMMMSLMHRDLQMALKLRHVAEAHAKAHGHTVHLVEFVRTQTIETLA